MSTRALKALTGFLIALGVAIMVGWPLFVGAPPAKGSPRRVYRAYVTKGLTAIGVLGVAVTGAGIGAFILMRRTRDEFRQEAMENMKRLIEGTREDQLRKRAEQNDGADG